MLSLERCEPGAGGNHGTAAGMWARDGGQAVPDEFEGAPEITRPL